LRPLAAVGELTDYAAMCVITFIFCMRLVPETKGKHLEDITAYFEERVQRHGNRA
jgi:hypothetical protein